MFDRRGTGLSDAVSSPPTLEQQMDDLDAVLDAAQSEQIALFGASDLGLSALYAATYPDRVTALVLSGVAADGGKMISPDNRSVFLDAIENNWGDGTLMELYAPSQAGNRVFADWWARMQRSAVSPGMARQLMEMITQTDLRAVLPTIRAPTLVTHMQRRSHRAGGGGPGRGRADPRRAVHRLSRQRRVRLGPDAGARRHRGVPHGPPRLPAARGRSGPGHRPVHRHRRLHGSARHSSATVPGGPCWTSTTAPCAPSWRAWRGIEIKTIGDGFLATFDGPARAVNCAAAIVDSLADLNLPIRAGVHTGECELLGDDVAGIAVHIGARVMERAESGRGARVEHGQGPRVRIGAAVLGSGRALSARRARRVAAVRAGALNPRGSKRSRGALARPRAASRARPRHRGPSAPGLSGGPRGSRTRAAAPRCREPARSRRRSTCPARTGAA